MSNAARKPQSLRPRGFKDWTVFKPVYYPTYPVNKDERVVPVVGMVSTGWWHDGKFSAVGPFRTRAEARMSLRSYKVMMKDA